MKETTEYYEAITSFSADLELARQGYKLDGLQNLIDKKDFVVMRHINLMSKLEFNLRHGKIKIIEIENGGNNLDE